MKRYVFDCKGCPCECRIALKDLFAVPCHCPAQEGRPNWKLVGEFERYEEAPERDKKMANKTCGECKLLFKEEHFCGVNGAYATIKTAACASFVPFTNGDKIRQMSNEEFATDYATYSHICDLYVARLCPPSGKLYTTMEEAIEANLAWLNAPAESEEGK